MGFEGGESTRLRFSFVDSVFDWVCVLRESRWNVGGGRTSLVVMMMLTEFEKNCSTFYSVKRIVDIDYPPMSVNDPCSALFEGFFDTVEVEC